MERPMSAIGSGPLRKRPLIRPLSAKRVGWKLLENAVAVLTFAFIGNSREPDTDCEAECQTKVKTVIAEGKLYDFCRTLFICFLFISKVRQRGK